MSFRDQAKHAAERADALEAENAKLRAEVERLKKALAAYDEASSAVEFPNHPTWKAGEWGGE